MINYLSKLPHPAKQSLVHIPQPGKLPSRQSHRRHQTGSSGGTTGGGLRRQIQTNRPLDFLHWPALRCPPSRTSQVPASPGLERRLLFLQMINNNLHLQPPTPWTCPLDATKEMNWNIFTYYYLRMPRCNLWLAENVLLNPKNRVF